VIGDGRAEDAPPVDALAEGMCLLRCLHDPALIDSVDLGPLLVFPEHRAAWQALVRTRMRYRNAEWSEFYEAWMAALEEIKPGKSWNIYALIEDVTSIERRRAEHQARKYETSLPAQRQTFSEWVERLRRIAQARAIISAAQEMAERAWRVPDRDYDVAAARRTLDSLPVTTEAVRIDL